MIENRIIFAVEMNLKYRSKAIVLFRRGVLQVLCGAKDRGEHRIFQRIPANIVVIVRGFVGEFMREFMTFLVSWLIEKRLFDEYERLNGDE